MVFATSVHGFQIAWQKAVLVTIMIKLDCGPRLQQMFYESSGTIRIQEKLHGILGVHLVTLAVSLLQGLL